MGGVWWWTRRLRRQRVGPAGALAISILASGMADVTYRDRASSPAALPSAPAAACPRRCLGTGMKPEPTGQGHRRDFTGTPPTTPPATPSAGQAARPRRLTNAWTSVRRRMHARMRPTQAQKGILGGDLDRARPNTSGCAHHEAGPAPPRAVF
ncbi:hypothetical protein HBH98_243950 [Parastagonospora nodorum]|nr:hypothetical protein HBH53_230600 [Parastagonospora nodorum]KAH3956362.1 hypothetical protein HBH51_243950 [Parastagonospora nodorum]KAH4215527.1 hypothetical protein HBI06_248000 [Parastagonospora nodorum]KAH4224220.1 hypothetical protein HBI05_242140 [Parastagonospora nodorum]KAH4334259.1 hypothetical protein HBH98_243950 [Parastagonospora nodorum]